MLGNIRDVSVRIEVVGPPGVGKTSAVSRCLDGTPDPGKKPTVRKQKLGLEKLDILCTIVDEVSDITEPSSYSPSSSSNTSVILLCFSYTDRSSFESIPKWLEHLSSLETSKYSRIILVGLKTDLVSERTVKKTEAEELALEYGLDLVEASSYESAESCQRLFYGIASRVGVLAADTRQANIESPQSSLGVAWNNAKERGDLEEVLRTSADLITSASTPKISKLTNTFKYDWYQIQLFVYNTYLSESSMQSEGLGRLSESEQHSRLEQAMQSVLFTGMKKISNSLIGGQSKNFMKEFMQRKKALYKSIQAQELQTTLKKKR